MNGIRRWNLLHPVKDDVKAPNETKVVGRIVVESKEPRLA